MRLQASLCKLLVAAVCAAAAATLGAGAALAPAIAHSAVTPPGAAVTLPHAGATAGATVCSFHLAGFGNRPGIKAASLSCTGGSPVIAAAHKLLQDFWGPRMPTAGVKWSKDPDCAAKPHCLLSVCGRSNVVFFKPSLGSFQRVPQPPPDGLVSLLCVTGQSKVTVRQGEFGTSNITPLAVYQVNTSVLVEQTTVHKISTSHAGAGLYVGEGSVVLSGSTFSFIQSNESGGAIWASTAAGLTIANSRFQSNTALQYGGAIHSSGQAWLEIGPGCVFDSNEAVEGGGDISAYEHSRIKVTGATFTRSVGGYGGSMMFINASAILVNTTILAAMATTGSGGAISLGGNASVTMISSLVSTCRSFTGGGGVTVFDGARFELHRSTFANNTALPADITAAQINVCTTYGGGISAWGVAKVELQSSQLLNNRASCGGAVATKENATVLLQRGPGEKPACVFVNNNAIKLGADLYASDNSRASIFGALFVGGRAEGGGACYFTNNSTATLQDTTIKRGEATKFAGGGVNIGASANVSMLRCAVVGCITADGGGGIGVFDQARLVLNHSRVANNTALKQTVAGGGVLAQDQATVTLENSQITGNAHPFFMGGGLSFHQQSTLVVSGRVVVANNTADTVGGGIRLASSNFDPDEVLGNIKAYGNKAPFGQDLSVSIQEIKVLNSSNADNFVPSDGADGLLRVTVNVTGHNGVPTDDPLRYIVYNAANITLYTGNIDTAAGMGSVREVLLRLKSPPGVYFIMFQAAWANIYGPTLQAATLRINIVRCPKGHVTAGRNDTCNPCTIGFYSFSSTDAQCNMCGANQQCPGGATLWSVPGYFQSAPQSTQMHRCFNPGACLGGAAGANNTSTTDYKTAQCSEQYRGNLCGSCKPNYGQVRPFLCRKCLPAGAIWALYAIAAGAMVGLVKLLVSFTTNVQASGNNSSSQHVTQHPLTPGDLLKVLVVHSQVLFITCNLVGVPWPPSLYYPLQVIAGIWTSASGSSLGFECVLQAYNGLPVVYQKVLICLFTPAGILLAVLLLEVATRYLKLRAQRSAPPVGQDFASVVMCTVFMFFPAWVSTALSLFACVRLDSPAVWPYQADSVGSYWVEDMSQECYTGYHRGWAFGLGIPLTLLFCLVLPAATASFMWWSRRQGKLSDELFVKHFGFLFLLWRQGVCWWEAVMLLQTAALVMVATFGFALGVYFQCLVTAAVLAVIATMLLVVRPFKCPQANTLAVISMYVLFATAYAALTFLPYDNMKVPSAYSNAMGAVILTANVTFLLAATWKLLRVMDWGAMKAAVGAMGSRMIWCGKKPPTPRRSATALRSQIASSLFGIKRNTNVGC